MTTFNYTFDTTYPDGSVLPGSILDDSDRLIKQAIQERENVDHYWPLTGTQVSDAKAGEHRKVQFYGVLTVKPVLAAGECALYLKTVAAKSELFFENEGGTEVQLTSVGSLSNIVLQTGTQTIAGAKTFTDGIVVNTQISGTAITDEDDMASDSAVKVPTEQSVKAYADAIAAAKGVFVGSGTAIFATTLTVANTWQDLDLSSIVGVGLRLVQLEVMLNADFGYMMKTKGWGETPPKYPSGYVGPNSAHFPGINPCSLQFTVMTDASGVVQHCGTNALNTVTVKVIGYVK